MSIRFFLGLILPVMVCLTVARAADESIPATEREMRERYEDFYIRMNDVRTRSYNTAEAKASERRRRDAREKELKQAREDYIRQRKKKVEVSDEMHEREIAEQKKKLEADRKQFVQAKERKANALKNVPQVPEWVEYRLYDDTLVSDSPAKSSN